MTSPADAMRRAARFIPGMGVMHLYTRANDPVHNRPTPNLFDWTETVQGSVRWRDLDEVSQLGGGEVGDGVASLVAPTGPVPDLIRTAAGDWLTVKGGAGRDAMGLAVKVAVMRWTGAAPTVQGGP